MSTQIKRMVFDFLARDYKTSNPTWELISNGNYPPFVKNKQFIQRWYLSLQGEDNPTISRTIGSQDTKTEQLIYRYDWAFGIAVIEGFYWDWMEEIVDESALAVHLILEPIENAPEAVPISATLSTLHPSRNTKSLWELAFQNIPKTAANMSEIAASTLPARTAALDYVSSGLMLTSNILESYTNNKKNWFLYQFLDERLKCPVVEWRINKRVLIEYGPLLRGTLFLAFYGSIQSDTKPVRVQLRPQIHYCTESDITFITPTNKLDKDKQVFIEVKAKEGKKDTA